MQKATLLTDSQSLYRMLYVHMLSVIICDNVDNGNDCVRLISINSKCSARVIRTSTAKSEKEGIERVKERS